MPTAASPQYLDPAILARLEGLALRARLVVEGYVAGVHRSPFHGFSIEFAEHREYTPGDDLRYLDWKVLARSDKYCLKQFEEETNLVCNLLLDTSESMTYQSAGADVEARLRQVRRRVAGLLDSSAAGQRRASDLRPRDPGHDPAQRQPVALEGDPAGHGALAGARKTATGPILHELAERFRKRGIVILFSDLLDDVDAILAGLKHFRHRRHEVVLMHVLDPAEVDFRFDQMMLFRGLEGLPELLAEPRALRSAYLAELQKFLHRLRQGCRQERIDYVLVRTDQSLEVVLSSYLASRK